MRAQHGAAQGNGSRATLLVLLALGLLLGCTGIRADCVVLLHGLGRTAASMAPMAKAFAAAGYAVSNVSYPSRHYPIEVLAPLAIEHGLAGCPGNEVIHFVAHSLGGILLRFHLDGEDIPNLGRVVMLGPPNQGTPIVDRLRSLPGFALVGGPAATQLGTDEQSVPLALGPARFELGIIAGTTTVNPLLSLLLPDPDDGKVSLASTRLEGMSDFIAVPHSHAFMMRQPAVIAEALTFIQAGQFGATSFESPASRTRPLAGRPCRH